MNVKVEKTENKNEVKLTFNIEAEKFEEAMKKVYAKTAKYFNIPGFRKGKAPMQLVERQYGSAIFYEDAFNELVPDIYDEAIKENNIEAVSRPNIDIVQMEKGKELIFTAVVETKPEVELGEYKGIEIKKIEYTTSEKDIEHELSHMAERNARLVTIEDRPVENGDIVTIDFDGSIDGVQFEGGKAESHELEIGSKTFIPGFEDQILGMNINDEKDVKVKFPDDYFSKDLAGKDAVFKVKLHEIKKKELPKMDDEFAKDVSEFDTISELKNSIKEKLDTENEERAKYEIEEEAIKVVCDNTTLDIPNGMVELEIDNMIKDLEMRLSYQGLKLEQYLQIMGKTEEDIRSGYEEQARKNIKTRLVLEAIAKVENLEPTPDEVTDKIKEMAKEYGREEEELLENTKLNEYIKNSLKTEKAIDFIVKNAKKKKETKKNSESKEKKKMRQNK